MQNTYSKRLELFRQEALCQIIKKVDWEGHTDVSKCGVTITDEGIKYKVTMLIPNGRSFDVISNNPHHTEFTHLYLSTEAIVKLADYLSGWK